MQSMLLDTYSTLLYATVRCQTQLYSSKAYVIRCADADPLSRGNLSTVV